MALLHRSGTVLGAASGVKRSAYDRSFAFASLRAARCPEGLVPRRSSPLQGATTLRANTITAAAAQQQQQQQQTAGAASSTPAAAGRAQQVVRRFYEAYNARDLDTIATLIADDISYHDLVYEEPHEGREGVMAWLEKVRQYAPDDLKFVIEDITSGDDSAAGVAWHVECGDGIVFPFSRGCSFIRLNREGKIVSVRDVVEPATKPGDATLKLLGALTPLIRAAGPAADPANLGPVINSATLWGIYATYLGVVMGSNLPPGPPAWATPGPVLAEAFDESVNIFWINEVLRNLHLSPIPVTPHHPVSEAIFNFVIAWAAMFVPVILTDAASKKIPNRPAWCTAIAFTTNIFFIPFLALRAAPEPPAAAADNKDNTGSTTTTEAAGAAAAGAAAAGSSGVAATAAARRPRRPAPGGTQPVPAWGRAVGAAGLGMCLLSVAFAFVGRPEVGGLAERAAYLQSEFGSNRVFWAFFLDCALFSVWQAVMLQGAAPFYRFTPVVGLAAWLIQGGGSGDGGSKGAAAAAERR